MIQISSQSQLYIRAKIHTHILKPGFIPPYFIGFKDMLITNKNLKKMLL